MNKQAERVPGDLEIRVEGIYRFPASVARRCSEEVRTGQPLFCVYETPTDDQPGHADILLTANQFRDDKSRTSATFDLGKELQRYFESANKCGFPQLATIRARGLKAIG